MFFFIFFSFLFVITLGLLSFCCFDDAKVRRFRQRRKKERENRRPGFGQPAAIVPKRGKGWLNCHCPAKKRHNAASRHEIYSANHIWLYLFNAITKS